MLLDFVSLKTNSAVAAIGKRAIEETILRLVGSWVFSHSLYPEPTWA
jgi:hypothetical protein